MHRAKRRRHRPPTSETMQGDRQGRGCPAFRKAPLLPGGGPVTPLHCLRTVSPRTGSPAPAVPVRGSVLDLRHDESDGLELSLILFSFSKECFLGHHHRSEHMQRRLRSLQSMGDTASSPTRRARRPCKTQGPPLCPKRTVITCDSHGPFRPARTEVLAFRHLYQHIHDCQGEPLPS